jgi:hypothetical protein
MRVTDLPYPGNLTSGVHLRREVTKALQSVDRIAQAMDGAGANHIAYKLGDFLDESARLAHSVKSNSTGPVLKGITTYNANKTWIVIEFDRRLDPQFLPATSGLTFNPAKTISDWAVDGRKLYVRVTADVAAAFTVAYAQQSDGIRDLNGNKAAAFSATTGTIVS